MQAYPQGANAPRLRYDTLDIGKVSMSWTDQRIDQLKALWEKGLTASQIAEELGGVSRNAVIGKAHRLGLKSRPSPVKANNTDKKAAPKKPAAAAPAMYESAAE